MDDMTMKCPECKKDVKFKVVDKLGETVGYKLEKIQQPIEYADFKEYPEPHYCFCCGHNLTERDGIRVCTECEIKYC